MEQDPHESTKLRCDIPAAGQKTLILEDDKKLQYTFQDQEEESL